MAVATGEESGKSMKMEDDIDHDFVHRMDHIIEHNATGISLAIGYRVGLIKTMAELEEPKTSTEIAEKAGLNERYLLICFFHSTSCSKGTFTHLHGKALFGTEYFHVKISSGLTHALNLRFFYHLCTIYFTCLAICKNYAKFQSFSVLPFLDDK